MTTLLLALCLQAQNLDQKALERLNFHRRSAGLEAAALDAALSKGCKAHADYLVKNADHASTKGLGGHDEDSSLPGYTADGARAGKASNISPCDPPRAIDGCMATLFHRAPLLHPGLKKIGVGAAEAGGRWKSVIDVATGRTGAKQMVVVYPADRQKDVPLALDAELPNPIPSDDDGKGGYPITAHFPDGQGVTDVTATLKADKADVEHWLSTPEKPADARYQRNTVCLITKDVLKPSTTYTVTVTAKVANKPWSRIWSFSTVKE